MRSLPFVGIFLRYLRFFLRLVRRRILVLIGLTLLTTWSEGVGIALLLPLLASGAGTATANPIIKGVFRALSMAGLPPTIGGVLVALVIIAFLKGALTFCTNGYQYYLSTKVTQDLRRQMLAACRTVDYRYMLSTSTPRLTSIIIGETASSSTAFLYFARLFPHAITILVFLAIVTIIDWRLALLVLLTAGAMFPLLRLPPRLARRDSARSTEEQLRFAALLMQALQAFKYLKATSGLDGLQNRFLRSVRRITVLNYRIGAASAFAYALPQPIVAVFLAGIMLYLVHRGGPEALSTGFVVLIYLYRTMNEVFALQSEWQAFAASVPAVDNVETTMRDLLSQQESTGSDPIRLQRQVELDQVTFAYGDRTVLDRVSLSIPRNAIVAFVGESGAGKSTLVDLVSGVLKPTAGSVRIDGQSLATADLEVWRRSIGYVPQDPMLFDDTVANNISFWSCDPSDRQCMEKIRDAAKRALCHEFIERMPEGYLSRITERGQNVSGGQRQRLAIARELFKNPDLLILDEATSALDTESEHFVRQSIEALKGSVTVLVIAHRLSTIKGCDRVYVLQAGRILEEGTYEELLAREGSRFRDLARMQSL